MAKIKTITVTNLKAVSALTADFNGCTAIITGGNNLGKSSFLRSLPDRIRGLKPDEVLKHNEKEGHCELVLTTGEKFIWSFTSKGEKLIFITEKNIKSSVTKDIAEYYFPKVFDVDKFLNHSPAEQRKVLQKITGIDFTEIEKLYKDAYEQRAFFNKQLVIEKAKAEVVDDKLPVQELPTDKLLEELHSIEAHNLRWDNVQKGIKDKEGKIKEHDTEIEELLQKIEAIKTKQQLLSDDIKAGEEWKSQDKNKPKTNQEELKAQIEEVKKQNLEIAENNKAIEQQMKIQKAQDDADYWDKEVKRIEAEKMDVIKNATMPDGFGFDDEGITYNGFAFSKQQLSSSGIYIASLKLAAVNLGEVKTLHFDASFLDNNSLSEIEAWAEENSLQLLIEIPDRMAGPIKYELVCPAEDTKPEEVE